MPEGDTVHKVARRLAFELEGQDLRSVHARRLDASPLAGARINAVISQGKYLSIVCDNGLTLRSHLGLYGAWHRYAPGEVWQRPPWQASVALTTDAGVFVCFNAREVEIHASDGWRHRDAQARLGPDLAHGRAPPADVLSRLQAFAGPATQLVDLLLDQRIAAGIGNVYKCEVLFLSSQSPLARGGDLPPEVLLALYDLASDLIRANLGRGPRVTRSPPDGRCGLWVYGRAGEPCLRCGTLIRYDRLGARPRATYWCPACQTLGRASAGAVPGAMV